MSVNYLTQDGARHIARNIEKYWIGQGYRPSDVGIQLVKDDKAEAVWVRSKLMNGTPPGKPFNPPDVTV